MEFFIPDEVQFTIELGKESVHAFQEFLQKQDKEFLDALFEGKATFTLRRGNQIVTIGAVDCVHEGLIVDVNGEDHDA